MPAVHFKTRFAERKHDRHFKKANYIEKISEQLISFYFVFLKCLSVLSVILYIVLKTFLTIFLHHRVTSNFFC